MSRWPVAGPSEYWLLDSSQAFKVKNSNTHIVQQIHIRWQQYTQEKLQQHIYKTTTTIHTANQQQLHTTDLKTSNKTHDTNYNTTCTKGTNTQVRQHCVQFSVIVFSIIISLTLSPQSARRQRCTVCVKVKVSLIRDTSFAKLLCSVLWYKQMTDRNRPVKTRLVTADAEVMNTTVLSWCAA